MARTVSGEYQEGTIERAVLNKLISSPESYTYDNLDQLKFELKMRREIIAAADALNKSELAFEVFRESRCNPEYWIRREDGGFKLKSGVKASDAIRDIFRKSARYGTECATALQDTLLQGAAGDNRVRTPFDKLFRDITLMNWNDISGPMREVGLMRRRADDLPGDRRYFANPDVNPETPEWQGENVIDMG